MWNSTKKNIGGFHTFNIQLNPFILISVLYSLAYKERMLEKGTLFDTQSLLLIINNEILKLKKKIYIEIFPFPCEMSIALVIDNFISKIGFSYQHKELFWICILLAA